MIPRSAPLNLLAAALSVLAPSVAAGQTDPPGRAEGALFLLLPVGAQSVALGRAMTWVEGAEGAFWNPAGLASLGRSQLVVFRGDDVAGTSTALSAFWSSPAAGTLGASYYLLDAGEIGTLPGNLRRFVSRFFKCLVSRKGYREGGWGLLIALCAGLYPLLAHLKARLEPERHRPGGGS